ncbi:hypothetical protein PR048_006204 [Dryococelus australis]|uniref:Integrase catalytic domain-containing protein n=1 Tax=Dryococelus australis TaxID=614101 RepID=A0ABQ9IBF5_9NEOP|nr:hypothetical protein PR048_006204 [Dryococelus australis]
MVLPNTTSTTIISWINNVFARHSITEVVCTHGWPQFTSLGFTEFAKEYEFKHCTSNPKFAQSNGQAENVVKIAKKLLFGRKLRTTLPVIRATQQHPVQHQDSETFGIRDQQLKTGARELRQLVVGERGWIPVLKQYGKVHAQAPFPHSFIVQTEQGLLWRNRVQLIPAPSSEIDEKLHGKSDEQNCHIPLTHHNQ